MSGRAEFVHLHNHSEYSLLDGITRWTDHDGGPSELLKGLAHEQARAIGVTDHGNLYGAIEFYSQCNKVGVKPIVGCEMYMAKGSRRDRGGSQKDNCHLTVLARNFEGYQNLLALSTTGFLEGFYYDARIDRELLAKHSKGLIVLSGCLKSEISQAITAGNLQQAIDLVGQYKDILEPECFYLEIMDHGLDKQRQVMKALLEIHERTKLPLVVTNDCHYAKKTDFDAHDARVCISTGRKIADTNRLKFESHEFYFKTPDEMHKIFSFAPEALQNTLKIADMCHLQIPMDQLLLPIYSVPAGENQDTYLETLCHDGLKRKNRDTDKYRERLQYELGVIKKMGFSGYFLIVWDFIKHAKKIGVPVGPGRGSGAGALVSYTLDITLVDPIEHNLLFERFLNPDRKSMPDLDIDFSDEGRERVIDYVRNKYGESNVARIITFSTMAARAAIRDVGRVLNTPLAEVDKLAKMVPMGQTIHQTLETSPELKDAAKNPEIKTLLTLAQKLEGLKRNTSVHAAGIVITKDPVVTYSPLSRNPNNEVITTQYDGEVLPKLGLLKMDFLGLRTLSIMQHAIENINSRHPEVAKPYQDFLDVIPLDDAKAFKLLQSGKTLGVFQLDSDGIRDLVRKLKPTGFADCMALVALYRPGPMKSGMVDDFVARKHGEKKIHYDHALLKPILENTYGCMIYQEQVMGISKSLAGFTAGQADGLRKAMGKKIPAELEKQRDAFVAGAKKNDISDKVANKIYDQMCEFGGYGFNASHSCAYGLLAYQTAWMKANYPLEFMTALATSEIGHSAMVEGKENKLVTYLDEAKSMGMEVLPPDINRSEVLFSMEGPAIRFGLVAIKNVGTGAAESIVAARADGPFTSLDDFCRRIDLKACNKKAFESLIKASAMDCLKPGQAVGLGRAALLASIEDTMDRQASVKEDMGRGQGMLFGAETVAPLPTSAPAEVQPLHEHDVLKSEKEVLGFYLSGHPLVRYADRLKMVSTHSIEKLGPEVSGPVRVAGMVVQVKKMLTKEKGEQYARGVLEDLTGEITILLFPRKYAEGLGKLLNLNAIVCIGGRLSFGRGNAAADAENQTPELIVDEIIPIDMAVSRLARRLTIPFSTAALEKPLLEDLRKVLAKHPGRCPVTLRLDTPAHGTAFVETETAVRLEESLFDELEKVLGEKTWQIESAS